MLVPQVAARIHRVVVLVSVLVLVVVGLVQAATVSDLGIGLLYLIPVSAIAWAGGRKAGLAAGVVASSMMLVLDVIGSGVHNRSVPYWNFGVSLVVFIVVSEVLPYMHRALAAERERARTDALTGLGNRRFFEAVARAELVRTRRYRRPLALGLVDVDYFKQVNDRLGHQAGDQLLRLIAREIRRVMRASDLVGRVGGDEFVVLLPETSTEGAEVAFRKMHGHLSRAVEREGFPVSFSLGAVACGCEAAVSLDWLLREADQVLYSVKKGGRGSVRVRLLAEAVEPAEAGAPG